MMGFSPRTTAMIEQRNETFRMNPAFTKTVHWHAGATNSQFCRGGVRLSDHNYSPSMRGASLFWWSYGVGCVSHFICLFLLRQYCAHLRQIVLIDQHKDSITFLKHSSTARNDEIVIATNEHNETILRHA